MIRCFLLSLGLTGAITLSTGCYSTSEGRVHAGVPFVKDSIESRYERPLSLVHDAAVEVLKTHGGVTSDDVVKRVVAGVAFNRKIWISFEESTPGFTTVITQARTKAGGADVDIASEIDKLIYGVLASGGR
jgi:hypothetical protein